MDPANPRWESAEARFARQKTLWSIIVGVTAGAALTTMIVVSCLDRGQARREPQEPSFVETTAAPSPAPARPTVTVSAPVVPAPTTAVNDSTGGPTGRGAPASTTHVTSAEAPSTPTATTPPAISATPRVTVAPPAAPPAPIPRAPTDTSSGLPPGGAPSITPDASSMTSDAGAAPPAPAEAPAPTMGAGRFITEAPPWAGSAFTDNPEAGAGPFPPAR